MGKIEFGISRELEEEVKKNTKIAWAKILERAIRNELGKITERRIILAALNKLLENSKMTEEDAIELGRKVRAEIYEKYKKEGVL